MHEDRELRVGGSASHRLGSMHGAEGGRVREAARHRLGNVHGDGKLMVGDGGVGGGEVNLSPANHK